MLYIDCSSRLNAAVSTAGHVTGVLKGLITIAVYVSFLFFLDNTLVTTDIYKSSLLCKLVA